MAEEDKQHQVGLGKLKQAVGQVSVHFVRRVLPVVGKVSDSVRIDEDENQHDASEAIRKQPIASNGKESAKEENEGAKQLDETYCPLEHVLS